MWYGLVVLTIFHILIFKVFHATNEQFFLLHLQQELLSNQVNC